MVVTVVVLPPHPPIRTTRQIADRRIIYWELGRVIAEAGTPGGWTSTTPQVSPRRSSRFGSRRLCRRSRAICAGPFLSPLLLLSFISSKVDSELDHICA